MRLLISSIVLCLPVVQTSQTLSAPSKRSVRPLAVSLLIETSPYLQPHRSFLVSAVKSFIAALNPADQVELIEYSAEVKIRQRFTSNRSELESALAKETSPSGRSIYAAARRSLTELEALRSTHQCDDCKLAMVVFAGGTDISSVITARQLLDIVRRSRDIPIYTIGISSKAGPLDRETDWVLRELANTTGGRAFFPSGFEDLASVYSEIHQELAR